MAHISQINYEETSLFAKNTHSEGDDLVQLHSQTRQRMQALRADWAGDAAEAFFEEMESELLPALQRVSNALFLSEEILNKIMKIIHAADEDTAGYFKDGSQDDFGAGLFGLAGGALGGVLGGAVAGGEDFGASKFGEALSAEGGLPAGTEPGGPSDTPGETPPSTQIEMEAVTTESSDLETPPAATETPAAESGGGGGGGGGESSQGMQGDLKGLGTGVGGAAQQMGAASGGPTEMPDHVYEGSSGGSPGTGTPQAGPAGGSGGIEEQSSGGVAGVVGAAGLLGAAAAAAAKVLKNDNNEPEE